MMIQGRYVRAADRDQCLDLVIDIGRYDLLKDGSSFHLAVVGAFLLAAFGRSQPVILFGEVLPAGDIADVVFGSNDVRAKSEFKYVFPKLLEGDADHISDTGNILVIVHRSSADLLQKSGRFKVSKSNEPADPPGLLIFPNTRWLKDSRFFYTYIHNRSLASIMSMSFQVFWAFKMISFPILMSTLLVAHLRFIPSSSTPCPTHST